MTTCRTANALSRRRRGQARATALQEKVSIRNLALILEVLADGARQTRDTGQLTELVRQRLGATICQALLGKGSELPVLTLDPSIEQSIAGSLRSVDEKSTLLL